MARENGVRVLSVGSKQGGPPLGSDGPPVHSSYFIRIHGLVKFIEKTNIAPDIVKQILLNDEEGIYIWRYTDIQATG